MHYIHVVNKARMYTLTNDIKWDKKSICLILLNNIYDLTNITYDMNKGAFHDKCTPTIMANLTYIFYTTNT